MPSRYRRDIPRLKAEIVERWRRAWKIELIERFNPGWRDLALDLQTE